MQSGVKPLQLTKLAWNSDGESQFISFVLNPINTGEGFFLVYFRSLFCLLKLCWGFKPQELCICTHLKPVDSTAVDERGKHSKAVSKSITNRTHCKHNVQVILDLFYKIIVHDQGSRLHPLSLQESCTALTSLYKHLWTNRAMIHQIYKLVCKHSKNRHQMIMIKTIIILIVMDLLFTVDFLMTINTEKYFKNQIWDFFNKILI